MCTNTYLPHVGGVARSVSTFADEYRKAGHRVLIVAPEYPGRPPPRRIERIVERVAAIQRFNGSDFSVRLPLTAAVVERIDAFKADIIHSHHPFLLGDSALRLATRRNVPVVFTHHTRYEDYTHYVPFDSPALKEAAIELATQYANLCEGVIAPSESIAKLIRERGVVESSIKVVPTGIDVEAFASGDGMRARRKLGLPARAFVVGHVGRLAPEKNLPYLTEATATFMLKTPGTHFLVVGGGPSEQVLRATFAQHGMEDRLVLAGKLTGRALCDAYRAMDVFAFASLSETQGMVVTEAMAAGRPVVALDAPGVREVVESGRNGLLLPATAPAPTFAAALAELHDDAARRRAMETRARATARRFSSERCAAKALAFYTEILRATRRERLLTDRSPWGSLLRRLNVEWELFAEKSQLLAHALRTASK